MAADANLSVLLVDLEGKPGLNTAFGGAGPLDYEEAVLWPQPSDPSSALEPGSFSGPGTIRARRVTPDGALLEYLADHRLERASKRLLSAGVIDVVSTAIPGIRDVLVLGKVKQLERAEAADLIIVDAPATGHAVTFLTSASGLLQAARGGPIRTQAEDVLEMLSDPARCQVVLVTLPEEMPVNETIEAAYRLEDKADVQLGPVVVNCYDQPSADLTVTSAEAAAEAGVTLDPGRLEAIDEARLFRLRRQRLQAEQVERLGQELPLPQLYGPLMQTDAIGPDELQQLASALARDVARLTPDLVPT